MTERTRRDSEPEEDTPPDRAEKKDESATPEDDGTLGLSQF